MADPREDILARLLVIAQGIDGVKLAARNTLDIPDTQFPAIVILDADEAAEDNDPADRAPRAPRRVGMTPEIFVILADVPGDIGAEINAMRAKLVKAVMTDDTLKDLTLDGLGIRYEGSVTSLSAGRQMVGDLAISFTFTYLLRVDSV